MMSCETVKMKRQHDPIRVGGHNDGANRKTDEPGWPPRILGRGGAKACETRTGHGSLSKQPSGGGSGYAGGQGPGQAGEVDGDRVCVVAIIRATRRQSADPPADFE